MPLVPFLPNLLLSILAGLLVSAWLLYCTDVFPAVGGLLGLGGLFTWIAFLLGLVSKSTKDGCRKGASSGPCCTGPVSRGPWSPACCCSRCGPQGGALFSWSRPAPTCRARCGFQVEAPTGETEVLHEGFLPAGQVAKLVLPDLLRWRPGGAYLVKIGGLPAAGVVVRPWGRTKVAVPEFFLRRPVVLVRPALDLTLTAENSPEGHYRLEVRRNAAVGNARGLSRRSRVDRL